MLGKSGDDIWEYFKTYKMAAIYCNIDDNLQLRLPHNCFDEEAKGFYPDKELPDSLHYETAEHKMAEQ